MRLTLVRAASIKKHDTTEYLRLSPITYHVGNSFGVLAALLILVVVEETGQLSIWVSPIENFVTCRSHPRRPVPVVAQAQIKLVQGYCYLMD